MDTCFCHPKPAPQNNEPTNSMELDAALNELGMLSLITDSRTDYLKEKMRKKKRSSTSLSSAPLCVVQMNSKFVTNFSLSKNSSDIEDDQTDKVIAAEHVRTRAVKKSYVMDSSHARRKARQFTPYKTPWKNKSHAYSVGEVSEDIPVTVADRASPPIVSRQDSGNKSNPNSPVKSQNCHPTPLGSSIVRSRSLDDLEVISKSDDSKDGYCCYGRSDIDTVSQRISRLNVS